MSSQQSILTLESCAGNLPSHLIFQEYNWKATLLNTFLHPSNIILPFPLVNSHPSHNKFLLPFLFELCCSFLENEVEYQEDEWNSLPSDIQHKLQKGKECEECKL
eukprot:CAMPEP_0174277242 /NCGR_PEP_ID=MMETSP0439-20130205/60824_1 /TAXON_ID=0 /ORGANISM="Stereomyxa ramosa, Strain Chinc5" /LENGTH=104 /DNA_ID=CAMNT_0015369543 /DNA_START=976 /DNA_END=1286 /DNA_ORIENTATION=+